MSADDDQEKSAESGAEPKRESKPGPRRQRPPVTIDLAAEPASGTANADAPKAETPKPDAPKKDAAAGADKPAMAGAAASDKPAATEKRAAAAGKPASSAASSARSGTAGPGAAARAALGGAGALRGAARALAADDNWRRTIIGAVAGALIALVLVLVLQAIGLLPSPGRATANAAAEQAKSAVDTAMVLERRVTAIETMVENLPALRSDAKALGDRIAALESAQGGLAKRSDLEALTAAVAALREKVDAMPGGASRADLAALADRIGRLEVTVAAGGGSSGGDASAAIDSLSNQLSAAEANLRSLNDRFAAAEANMSAAAPTGGDRAVRAIAVASLRRAAQGDAPFVGDVDMISALGVATDEIAKLRPIAATGAVSKASLASEFPAVADAILSASANSDPNAGFFQRVLNGLGSLVTVRPTGPVAGTDPSAIVSRMTADVDNGDLAAALKERDGLPEAGQNASADWAKKATDRVALDQLIEQIAAALDTPKT